MQSPTIFITTLLAGTENLQGRYWISALKLCSSFVVDLVSPFSDQLYKVGTNIHHTFRSDYFLSFEGRENRIWVTKEEFHFWNMSTCMHVYMYVYIATYIKYVYVAVFIIDYCIYNKK